MKRLGSATWNGDLRNGEPSVSTESCALESHHCTFFSRYGEKLGTNPEELLGAAHCPVSKLMKVEIGFGATLLS
jgi:lipoyl-dependent peroxiredoxin